jgi:hypothetical protein
MPQACETGAASKAADRFWSNPQVTPQAIQRGQAARTMERIEQENSLILAIQDTTNLVSRTHPAMTGLGPLPGAKTEDKAPQGMRLHVVVAVHDQGDRWDCCIRTAGFVRQRTSCQPGPQSSAKHARRPGAGKMRDDPSQTADEERSRWLSSVQAMEQQTTTQRVLVVGDREADSNEWYAQPHRAGLDLLGRVSEDRLVFAPERTWWESRRGFCSQAMAERLGSHGC